MTEQQYSELAYLRSTWMKLHNKDVREHFRDVDENDTSKRQQARYALKLACLIKNNGLIDVILQKTIFFYLVLRKAQDLQVPVIGMPINQYDQMVKYAPVVTLYFKQIGADMQEAENPLTAQISIRLVKETSETITKAKLTSIAREIKREFMDGDKPYAWFKGRTLVSYRDPENGLRLRLYVRSETEAEEIIRKVCRIANTNFKQELVMINKASDITGTFPVDPGNIRILGNTYKKPRKRPIGKVRFTYASCKIWGMNKPVILCQAYNYFRDPLVK